jgi:Protein of unknown function (DUF3102)
MSNLSEQNIAGTLPATLINEALQELDCAGAPAEDHAKLDELARTIRNCIGYNLGDAVKAGRALIVAKNLAGHGNFLPWLRREFEMTDRTARNYMVLVPHFENKTESFSDLRLKTARALIADPNENVRNAIFQRVDAGEIITEQEVKKAIGTARKAAKNVNSATKPTPGVLALLEARTCADRLNVEGIPEPFSQPETRPEMQTDAALQADQNADSVKDQPLRMGFAPGHRMMVIGVHPTHGKSQEERIADAFIALFWEIGEKGHRLDPAEIASQLWQNEANRHQFWKKFEFIKTVEYQVQIIREANPPTISTGSVSSPSLGPH